MEMFYTYAAIGIALLAIYGIFESIYLKRTKHDDHSSRYINEIFYEEIQKKETK